MKEDFIKNIPLFADFSDSERRAVAKRMRLETYEQDELVFARDTESDAVYLIKEGWVKLTEDGRRTPIATLGPGSLLGETDFFLGRERSMTARATAPLSVWVLDENAILNLIEEYNEVGLKLGLALGHGIAQYQLYLMNRLGDISFLRDLDEEQRQAVAECLAPQQYEPGEPIFRSGDAASGLYLIERGSVRLIGDGDDDYTELGAGDTFGEMAVLSGKPHPNTAQAASESVVWQLSPADFSRLADSYPELRGAIARNLRSRLSAADVVQAIGVLKRVPLFSELPHDALEDVAQTLLLHHAPAGEVIYTAGEQGNAMYFLESGQVEIYAEDDERRETLARLIPGDYFGETALLTGKSRTVTAQAATHSNLWVLYRTDFDNLLVRHPSLTVALSDALRQRLAQAEGSFVEAHLHNIALLGGLSRVQLEELAERLQPQDFASGEVIYFEGRTGDAMYFVESGQVERAASSSRGPVVLETLETGDFFGEATLLTGKPHIDTARALTDCHVWALKKQDFDDLLFKYPNLAVILSRALSERQYDAMEKLRARPTSARRRPAPSQPGRRREPAPRPRPQERRPAPAPRRPTAPPSRPKPKPSARRRAPSGRRPSPAAGIGRGAGRLSRRVGGAVGEAAVWFATRSLRVKLGILMLLMLLVWLFFIAAPSALIRQLAANLNGGENDVGYAYAQSDVGGFGAQSAVLAIENVRENGAVAALPFMETVTPTPTYTPTPTNTPTITPTPTETPIPTSTPTPVNTPTPLPPTPTPTLADTPTPTVIPNTPTPRPPTNTPTPSATPTPDADYIIASQRQLTACENEGKHHIFIQVVDKNGNGLNGVPLDVCWGPGEGDCAHPLTETKERGKGWVEFAMFKGTYSVKVSGAKSQVASGITPDYQLDELCPATGNNVANSRYHASFEVVIQRTW